ncbi:MAG: hypothetical protein GY805_01375 [Chloroflexi bacterium]|nr:hypothetical protein [Chloroflexota bacterium]
MVFGKAAARSLTSTSYSSDSACKHSEPAKYSGVQHVIYLDVSRSKPAGWPGHVRHKCRTVAHLPRLDITATETDHLQHGRRPPRRPNLLPAPLTHAYDPDGRFIGIVAVNENYLQPRKIFL